MRCLVVVACVLMLAACATTTPRGTSQAPTDSGGAAVGASGVGPARGNKSPYEVFGKTYHVMPSSLGYLEIGIASWYGKKFQGRLTSNGETFNMYAMSAAHKSLPLPTMVRVTNLDNGKRVIVRVNDRGPFHDDRLIDLSYETALKLGFADKGTAPVVVEAVDELNYPELVKKPEDHQSFYLQVGAFSRLRGAEQRLKDIQRVIEFTEFKNVDVRILQSELNKQTILHKVWLGPIKSEDERDQLAHLVESKNLGVALPVKVE